MQEENIKEPQYIRISELAEATPYTKEYLGILARQGKINAKRFGKIWYSTKEAVEEYQDELRKKYRSHPVTPIEPMPSKEQNFSDFGANNYSKTQSYASYDFNLIPPDQRVRKSGLNKPVRVFTAGLVMVALFFVGFFSVDLVADKSGSDFDNPSLVAAAAESNTGFLSKLQNFFDRIANAFYSLFCKDPDSNSNQNR